MSRADPLEALFVVPSLSRGGAEMQLVTLLNAMPADVCKPTLVVLSDGLALREQLNSHVEVLSFPRRRKLDMSPARKMASLIDSRDFDTLHATLNIAVAYASIARRWARKSPRLVAAMHTTKSRSLKEDWLLRLVHQRYLRQADALIFVCEAQAEFWRERFAWLAGRGYVVYNGVDTEKFEPNAFAAAGHALRNELGIGSDERLAACIAAFRPEKAHDKLIAALAKTPPNLHLALAGAGPLEARCRQLAGAAGLAGRVHFLGLLDDVRPLLAAADASVLASTAVETFSIAMLESLSMSTPMVATDIGGLREAILPGESGVLVPPGDVAALATALRQIVTPEWGALGERTRRLVETRFSVPAMTAGTLAVLRPPPAQTAAGQQT